MLRSWHPHWKYFREFSLCANSISTLLWPGCIRCIPGIHFQLSFVWNQSSSWSGKLLHYIYIYIKKSSKRRQSRNLLRKLLLDLRSELEHYDNTFLPTGILKLVRDCCYYSTVMTRPLITALKLHAFWDGHWLPSLKMLYNNNFSRHAQPPFCCQENTWPIPSHWFQESTTQPSQNHSWSTSSTTRYHRVLFEKRKAKLFSVLSYAH